MESQTLLVMTTLPDPASAQQTARILVEARLAACVSVLSPCTSVYRWQDAVETASEIPVLIKTSRDAYPRLEQRLRECHPYELPEILAISIEKGLPDYLRWIIRETETSKNASFEKPVP
jgi:periplasmic divalent cation tolerance protein